MNLDEQIDAFLEHHGVKGQKWGVRNKITSFNVRRGRQKQLHRERLQRVKEGTATKQDVRNIRARTAGQASIAVTTAIGAAFLTNTLLKKTGHKKVSVLLPSGMAKTRSGEVLWGTVGKEVFKVRVRDLPKLHENPLNPNIRKWIP